MPSRPEDTRVKHPDTSTACNSGGCWGVTKVRLEPHGEAIRGVVEPKEDGPQGEGGARKQGGREDLVQWAYLQHTSLWDGLE